MSYTFVPRSIYANADQLAKYPQLVVNSRVGRIIGYAKPDGLGPDDTCVFVVVDAENGASSPIFYDKSDPQTLTILVNEGYSEFGTSLVIEVLIKKAQYDSLGIVSGYVDQTPIKSTYSVFLLSGFADKSFPEPNDFVWARDLGFPWNDTQHPEKCAQISNKPVVFQAIDDILLTGMGERLFRQDYGSPINDSIWETLDSSAMVKLEEMLETCERLIEFHEKRVKVVKELSSINLYPNDHTAVMTIAIRFLATGQKELIRRRFNTK